MSSLTYGYRFIAKYCEMALTLQDKINCNETLASVTFFTYGISFSRVKKLSDCLKPLRVAYETGIKSGEYVDIAMMVGISEVQKSEC